MSVYKNPKTGLYEYSFTIKRHRVHGSPSTANRREAEAAEQQAKDQLRQRLKAEAANELSLRLDDVTDHYWIDVGQHHAGHDNTWRLLGWLVDHFGKERLITEITHEEVAKMIGQRRLDVVPNSKPPRLISPYTVNDTIEQLKKLFTYCAARGVEFKTKTMPKWKELWLAEPPERVRELHDDEGDRLDEATRDDWTPLFDFARVTGKRKSECYTLRWDQVHWDTGWIERPGKGGRIVRIKITDTVRAILWPLRGHHPEFVFTYVAQRTTDKIIRGVRYTFVAGRRYPITKSGLNTRWRRTKKDANLTGFRFHDFRHDVATKVLRETGNLKTVQKLLDHSSITTTARYAHVLDDEVADAMEAVATKARKNHPKNHPKKRLRTA
jgi:integrase